MRQIRSHTEILIGTALVAWLGSASAAVLYVNVNSTNAIPPYTNWATAANVIQDAIEAASPGDEVVVTNGVYQSGGRVAQGALTNRVAVIKPLAVRSVNGPNVTVIRGYQVPGTTNGDEAVRCAYLTTGASLIGFTLTGGATRVYDDGGGISDAIGGGVWCAGNTATAINCVIISNSASLQGGGAYDGTLTGCTLSNNTARVGGGAAGYTLPPPIPWSPDSPPPPYIAGMTLENCTIANNSAVLWGGGGYAAVLNNCVVKSNSAQSGGGVDYSRLNRCTLTGNNAGFGGGASGSSLTNCTLTGNWASSGAGATDCQLDNSTLLGNSATLRGGGALSGTLRNCLLTGNSAPWGGGANFSAANNCVFFENVASHGGGVFGGTLNNCTIVGNVAVNEGGGVWGKSVSMPPCIGPECPDPYFGSRTPAVLNNCIVYSNHAASGANYFSVDQVFTLVGTNGVLLNYSCTTPLPTNGISNITNAPLFLDAAVGNFRLQSTSPCINAGRNAYTLAGPDLGGEPRMAGGTADIGAYEFQSPQSIISYAWRQQYFSGRPPFGLGDFDDADGDGQNNWQEWRASTDPTNSASALRLLRTTAATNGVVVLWQSVSGQTYCLERSSNLTQGSFEPIATNIIGQFGATTCVDTNAPPTHSFYRVSVAE